MVVVSEVLNLNSTIRQIAFWALILGGAFLLYTLFHNSGGKQTDDIKYDAFMRSVDNKEIKSITIDETSINGELANGRKIHVEIITGQNPTQLADYIRDKNPTATIEFKPSGNHMFLFTMLGYAP